MEETKQYKTEKLGNYILDIAAGPFGSNLKVECFVSQGFPIIDGANLKDFKVTDNISKFVTEEKARSLHRSIAKRNDVVVTISGNVGQISYIPLDSKYKEYLVSQRQFRATFDTNRVYVPYLVYYFHTLEGQHKILSFANQTGVPALAQPLKNFKNIDIALPPISEQKRIANILSSLDDKIEVNRRINENLEQQAQALFKSWFVDFEPFRDGEFVESELGRIPKGWRVGAFGELMNISSGKRPAKKSSTSTSDFIIPLIGASEVMGYTNSILHHNRLLVIGRVGTHGIVQRFNEPCWPSDNTLVITSDFYEYCYQVLLKIDYQSLNRGSTQPLITQTDIKNQVVIIPDLKILNLYEEKVGKLMQLRENNLVESRRLATLRDTLLPKLMSGELKVNEIEKT